MEKPRCSGMKVSEGKDTIDVWSYTTSSICYCDLISEKLEQHKLLPGFQ